MGQQNKNINKPSKNKVHSPKNFWISFKRIFSELSNLRTVLFIAIIFSIFSSLLTIFAPNQISKLTDEISKGIGINNQKLIEVGSKINENMQLSSPQNIEIEDIEINIKDQIEFLKKIEKLKSLENSEVELTNENQKALINAYESLPLSVKKIVEPKINMEKIKSLSIFLIIIYLLSGIFNYLQSFLMADLTNNFANNLRNKVSKKNNRLPLNYFDTNSIGDILSRITNDVDSVAMNLNQSLGTLSVSITMLIGSVIMMFYTNWKLALVAIFSSLFGFIFMFIILNKSQIFFRKRQAQLGNINGFIEEIYSGIHIVKVYNAEKEAKKEFRKLNLEMYKADIKSKFLSGLMHPIMMFIGNFGYVAVSIVGALFAKEGVISFGVIVAFMAYVRLFTNPLAQIAQSMQALQASIASSDRVFNFMDEKEMSSRTDSKYIPYNKVKGKIEFKNISFKYPTNEKNTIKNFSAIAYPGQKIAIVGPTGAGKSTMVNLLMKFYEITEGDILIDGVSIHDLTRENIRELFTMVLQDTWLFEGTIKENIVYNMKNITDEDLKTLSKYVGLSHFINTLPDGFDTIISDSDSVSAGQRQLLTIARGMLKQAPFLILDEATSNVDTRTEEIVQKAMDKLMYGKTSFIIAHRLSTIINSDLIIVMNEGNIVEQGTHSELMKLNGFYAELYNSQFSL